MNPYAVTLIDHTVGQIAAQVQAIQSAAYLQEAKLLGASWFPPLERTAADIQRSPDLFFGAYADDVLVGVASLGAASPDRHATIASMTVAPTYQRRGIARALLASLMARLDGQNVIVSTGARNTPALALYSSFGFVVHRHSTVGPEHLALVELRRKAGALDWARNMTLRPLSIAELRIIADAMQDDDALYDAEFDGLPPPFVARRALEQIEAGKPASWCSPKLIVRTSDQAVMGGCGFKDTPVHGCVEIGYAVSSNYRQQGVATSAIRALLALAYQNEEVAEVLATISPTNLASMRVVQKLGFARGSVMIDPDEETLVCWHHHRPQDIEREALMTR